jgi:hypothetical protein
MNTGMRSQGRPYPKIILEGLNPSLPKPQDSWKDGGNGRLK